MILGEAGELSSGVVTDQELERFCAKVALD